MSQHPSLRSASKDKKHRSVLKRYERIAILKEKERWKDEESVYGLAKVKVQKFKVKKDKGGPEEEEGAEGAAAAEGATPATAEKQAAPAKDAGKGAGKGAAPEKKK